MLGKIFKLANKEFQMSLATNICVLLVFTAGATFARKNRCSKYTFFNEDVMTCQGCSLCAPGTFMQSACKGKRDTVCRGCRQGSYSTSYTRFIGTCRQCSECGDRPVLKKCTKKSDTVCGECPLGTYWDFLTERCVPCSFCFPDFRDAIPTEPTCEKPEIPVSHQCIQIAWPPYEPPYLIPRTDENGNKYFVPSSIKEGDAKILQTSTVVFQFSSSMTDGSKKFTKADLAREDGGPFPDGEIFFQGAEKEETEQESKSDNVNEISDTDDTNLETDELQNEVLIIDIEENSRSPENDVSLGKSYFQNKVLKKDDQLSLDHEELVDKSVSGSQSGVKILTICGVIAAVLLALIACMIVVKCHRKSAKMSNRTRSPIVQKEKLKNCYAQLKNENFV